MIEVQASGGSVELDNEDRFLLRALVREIRQASYLLEGDSDWVRFLKLRSEVSAERMAPEEVGVEIRADQMEWLGRLAHRTCGHLGADEFRTRTGRTLQEAQDLLLRLTRARVRLMAEYECHPIWLSSFGNTENVAADSLSISQPLASSINEWAESYEATHRPGDPISSGFEDRASERAFAGAGASLAARLQEELGEAYSVTYFNALSSADAPPA